MQKEVVQTSRKFMRLTAASTLILTPGTCRPQKSMQNPCKTTDTKSKIADWNNGQRMSVIVTDAAISSNAKTCTPKRRTSTLCAPHTDCTNAQEIQTHLQRCNSSLVQRASIKLAINGMISDGVWACSGGRIHRRVASCH